MNDAQILIVEDERVSRKALTMLLNAQGYQTISASSAEEALGMLDSWESPGIALLDVDLPGMSGLELAAQLEEMMPNLFTILITAAEGERVQNFLRDHPMAYLRKPLAFNELLHLLDEAQLH